MFMNYKVVEETVYHLTGGSCIELPPHEMYILFFVSTPFVLKPIHVHDWSRKRAF